MMSAIGEKFGWKLVGLAENFKVAAPIRQRCGLIERWLKFSLPRLRKICPCTYDILPDKSDRGAVISRDIRDRNMANAALGVREHKSASSWSALVTAR